MKSTEVLEQFLQAHPHIEIFEVILHDLNGVHRGKWLPREQIHKLFEGGYKMPQSSCSLDSWGRDLEQLVTATGDTDGICTPHPETLAIVPWASRPTAQIIVSMLNPDGLSDYPVDPRVVLQQVIARYTKLGLTPVVASEMEFHLLEINRDQFGRPEHTQRALDGSPALGGATYSIEAMRHLAPLMDAISSAASQQNLPVDTLISEFGASQCEINLHHQNSALRACDQASMLRRAIRAVAQQQGKQASFMAKPFAEDVGNGMHVHFSLIDSSGNNVFDNGTPEGSELLHQAVAGCLKNMADSVAIFAPNINSYRRLVPGCYAPTAPTWGYENRTTALRIPAGKGNAMRIEHRVAGADANVYLTVAAMLAAALDGIENTLSPPAAIKGDTTELELALQQKAERQLPRFWGDALEQFEQSEFIENYLGEEFRTVYAQSKHKEKAEFDSRVTLLEYDAYL
ncbi:Gamma-glutamylputrescine synthetase PuuA [Gammaproteobacteria bacterium MOLA455]|nr:Gamma-glutamylputrescine synthetase PuuA [Gammaproteobacteria bacterium MOLA455]